MLRITDAARLAGTKLRTRKVRLALTTLGAGLLFAILTTALTISSSTLQSLAAFSTNNLSGRYFVQQRITSTDLLFGRPAPEIIQRAEALHAARVAEKKAAAKRLGIEYDATTEPTPFHTDPDGKPQHINIASPAAQQAVREHIATLPYLTHEQRDATARKLGVTQAYDITMLRPKQGNWTFMRDGREAMSPAGQEDADPAPGSPEYIAQSMNVNEMAVIDDALMDHYRVPHGAIPKGAIPVIIQQSQAAGLLGLAPLDPRNTSKQQQIERLQTLRDKAGGLQFSMCYRNEASRQLLTTALEQQQAAKKPKPATPLPPPISYAVPTADSCGAVTIAKDRRTAAEKKMDDTRQQFEQQFSDKPLAPQQQKLSFFVVGLRPDDATSSTADSAVALLQFIAINNHLSQESWFVPRDALRNATESTETANYITTEPSLTNTFGQARLYEFATPDAARKYMQANSCFDESARGSECPEGAIVLVDPVGNNELIIDDFRRRLTPIVFWAFAGVVTVASFILLIIIARSIADSRKESAVFRALGATRLAISQIYLSYTLFVALITAALSIVLGLIGAWLLDYYFTDDLTIEARFIMTPRDLTTEFQLFAVNWQIIGMIIAGVVAAAIIASLLPILRGMRRNPMRDMRDE
ncbi:MAG: FtsX-like permease family protein [Candidatus Saccharibacteria bacterium]|nr:FtsX-like permease family protein [Candidatus Saccharibacteria bacterium]